MPCRKWKYSADDALAMVIFLSMELSQRHCDLDGRRSRAMTASDHELKRRCRHANTRARRPMGRDPCGDGSRIFAHAGPPEPECQLQAAPLRPRCAPLSVGISLHGLRELFTKKVEQRHKKERPETVSRTG